MHFKGLLNGLSFEWEGNNRPIVKLTVLEGNLEQINALQGKELLVDIVKWKKKRSLDANAYLWVLCTGMAEVLKTSKEMVYEDMLQKYGVLFKDQEGYITITVKACVDMAKINGHWKYYKGNSEWKSYMMLKGTSMYDSKEMAQFLDLVVGEANDLGVPTLPPHEIERMAAAWQST